MLEKQPWTEGKGTVEDIKRIFCEFSEETERDEEESNDEETDDDDEQTTQDDTTDADDDGAGFAVGGALAGAGGTAYLLSRRLSKDQNKTE